MVHLLGRFYPTDTAARVTADADAGMETGAAADAAFHTALLARGYRLVTGNHYEAPSGDDTPEVRGSLGSRHQWSPDRTHRIRRARLRRHPRLTLRARLDRTIWGDAESRERTLISSGNGHQDVVIKGAEASARPVTVPISERRSSGRLCPRHATCPSGRTSTRSVS